MFLRAKREARRKMVIVVDGDGSSGDGDGGSGDGDGGSDGVIVYLQWW